MAPISCALVPTERQGPFFPTYRAAFDHFTACRYGEVVRAHERLGAGMRVMGDVESARYLQYAAVMALPELGRLEEAVELVAALVDELDAGELPLWRAKALALSAELCLRAGMQARAVDHVAQAQELLETTAPDSHNHRSATMALGLALQVAGLFEDAEAALHRVLASVSATTWMQPLDVLPELTLLHAEWAARADLGDDAAGSERHWTRVVSLALRWRRAARRAQDPVHVARSLACEALAWTRLDRRGAAAAAVGHPSLLVDSTSGLVEGSLADLYRADVAAAAGRYEQAHADLDSALAVAAQSEPGVWTATILAAQAEVDVAALGPHAGVERWRSLAQGLLKALATQRRSFASEVAARRRLATLSCHADRISRDVLVDPLTGLANRRALDEALGRADGEGTSLGACFVDVDSFKRVNDTWSHAVGDEVLRRIGGILAAACRAGDLVARYGGDEFVVLTDADPRVLEPLGERVREAVAAHPWRELDPELAITVSVGIAPSLPAAAVLAAADSALLAAKRGGRDRVVTAR